MKKYLKCILWFLLVSNALLLIPIFFGVFSYNQLINLAAVLVIPWSLWLSRKK